MSRYQENKLKPERNDAVRLKDTSKSNLTSPSISTDSSLGILSLNSTDTSNLLALPLDDKKSSRPHSNLISKHSRHNTSFLEDDAALSSGNTSSASRNTSSATDNMLYKNISLLSKELMSGTESIKDLCERYGIQAQNHSLDISKEEFIPAEKMAEKLKADELSWRKRYDTIPKEAKDFSCAMQSINETSVGNYFIRKCQNLSDMSIGEARGNKSALSISSIDCDDFPERDTNNLPSKMRSEVQINESTLSISKIGEMIQNFDTPETCIRRLLNKSDKSSLDLSNSKFLPQINSTLSDELNENNLILKEKSFNVVDNFNLKQMSLKQNISSTGQNALTGISENKENAKLEVVERRSCGCKIDRRSPSSTSTTGNNNHEKSIVSTRSGSSLNTFTDGKIPIQVSNCELLWGCVKIGKREVQQLIIKNKCQKKIYFMMNITGSCYRILKDASGSDYHPSLKILMHPLETKSFNVSFSPSKVGASVEKITFSAVSGNNSETSQKLRLYGYGGHTSLNFNGVLKDATGRMYLSFGKIEYDGHLTKEIIISNNGNVAAFVSIEIKTKDVHYLSKPRITTARNLVLAPNKTTKVILLYTPTRSDLKYLNTVQSNVVEIASLKIIHGSEVVRGRIRKLCNKLKKSNNTIGKVEEQLSERFLDESIPNDLDKFNETVGGMDTLLKKLAEDEIILTLELNNDTTIIPNINESTMFESLLELNDTVLEKTIMKQADNNYNIEPKQIVLTPPSKFEDNILICCDEIKSMPYSVRIEPDNKGIDVKPKEGVVKSNNTTVLKVTCSSKYDSNDNFNVFVYVGHEVTKVNVKIFKI